jgi:hypothetical protein
MVFAEIVPRPGTKAESSRVFMLARGDQILTVDAGPLAITAVQDRAASNGTTYPGQMTVDWRSGQEMVHMSLTSPKNIANFGKYLRFLSDIEMQVT